MSFSGRREIPSDIEKQARDAKLEKVDFYAGPVITPQDDKPKGLSEGEKNGDLEKRMHDAEKSLKDEPPQETISPIRGLLRSMGIAR